MDYEEEVEEEVEEEEEEVEEDNTIVSLIIVSKDDTIIKEERFDSVEEAAAYLGGMALGHRLENVVKIHIDRDNGEHK